MKVQTILVPTDFSPAAHIAYQAALMWARAQDEPAKIVLMNVVFMGHMDGWRVLIETPDDIEAELTREAFTRLEELRGSQKHDDIEVSLRVASGAVVDSICEVAEEEDATLIVCGATHRSKAGAALLGTSAHSIVSVSGRPTLIVPEELPERIETILAPIELDATARLELSTTRAWADRLDAAIEVAHAVAMPTTGGEAYLMGLHEIVPAYLESRTNRLDELLAEYDLQDLPSASRHVEMGQPHEVIEKVCGARDIDLVVIASRCRKHIAATLLGGTATRVLRKPPVPVLVVPRPL